MLEISNSLRQRLHARPQPQEHPDPDILTAYVEQVLPAAERTQVLMHLSECSYCREVVSLSLPHPVAQQLVQQVAVRSRFWIAAFRWGAAVAMVAVAATLVVEKPWRTLSSRQALPGPLSQASQPTPPPAAAPAPAPERKAGTNEPAASDGSRDLLSSDRLLSAASDARAAQKPAVPPLQAGVVSEIVVNRAASSPQRAAPPSPPKALAVMGGAPQEHALESFQVQAPPREAMATRATLTQQAASTTVDVDAGQDYVNTNALRKDKAADGNGAAIASDAGNAFPPAPAPRSTSNQPADTETKSFPPVTLDRVTRSAFAVNITPPTTTSTTPSSPTDFNTLKSSKGLFKIPRRVGGAVVQEIERAGAAQPPAVTSFSKAMAKPSLKQADSGNEAKAENRQEFWRVVNGTLMKSSDGTQWHEAYPQGPELQFKVVITEGRQIWAGGNNATLIHSWNGGVDWEKLKVPDSGDITAITVDDGWQVKTSSDRTFVSQDRGKTWNPR